MRGEENQGKAGESKKTGVSGQGYLIKEAVFEKDNQRKKA